MYFTEDNTIFFTKVELNSSYTRQLNLEVTKERFTALDYILLAK